MPQIQPPIEFGPMCPMWMQVMMRAIGSPLHEDNIAWAMHQAFVEAPKEPATWRTWGYDIKTPEYGCVVCAGDHVGLFQRQDGDDVYLVGTQQGDVISVVAFKEKDIHACRWPKPEDFSFRDYPHDDRVVEQQVPARELGEVRDALAEDHRHEADAHLVQQAELERFAELRAAGALGHLGQRLHDLVFGVVQVLQLMHQKFLERFEIRHDTLRGVAC
jgi:hypothetical protein